jgi:hypothetical protein
MIYEGGELDALIAKYDKTGDPDCADFVRRYSKHWGGVTGADEDWFYFGNGETFPSRPRSLGERWATEAKFTSSTVLSNR